MIFLLTTIDEAGQIQEFSAHLDELEQGFDLTNDIVAMGHVLLRVRLRDQDKLLQLPVDAFTGHSFSSDIQQLEQEWQAILQSPINHHTEDRQAYCQIMQDQLAMYDERIVRLELVITRLTALIERAHHLVITRGRSGQFIPHFESIVSRYGTQLTRIYSMRHRLRTRLHELDYP